MNAPIKLFLCFTACMLAVAPGCTKRPNNLTRLEQLEADRKKYENRGIALIVAGPITMAGSILVGYGSAMVIGSGICGSSIDASGIGLIVAGAITAGAGIYMLGQGIHDLAKAKKLRRLQKKDAALLRKLEQEIPTTQQV